MNGSFSLVPQGTTRREIGIFGVPRDLTRLVTVNPRTTGDLYFKVTYFSHTLALMDVENKNHIRFSLGLR